MTYFLRYEPDGLISMNILLIRIVFVIMLLLAHRFRDKKTLLSVSLFVSVTLQVIMLLWYTGDKSLLLKEGLPLYHCRLAALMTAAGYVLKKKSFTKYFAWLGLIGAAIAFAFPDPMPFVWPHVTNVTYIGTHISIGMSSLILITGENTELKVRPIVIYTLVMNGVLALANHLFDSNYGYLMRLPEMFPFRFGRVELFVIMFILIAGGTYGCEKIYSSIKKKSNDSCGVLS